MTTDHVAATELKLYLDNDAETYRTWTLPVIKNMVRKMKAETYDHELAVKAWEAVAMFGAQRYAIEFAQAPEWRQIFPPETRREVARMLRDSFEAEYAANQYKDL